MKDRLKSWAYTTAVIAALALPQILVFGQARGGSAPPQAGGAQRGTAPAAGQRAGQRGPATPDLQGIWQVFNTSYAYGIEAHSPALGIHAGAGALIDTPDGLIPYTTAGRAKQQENFKNRAALDPINKCYKPGVPRITYMPFPFQIVQTPDYVTFIYEYIHNTRVVYMNRKTHPDGIDFWNGDSIGRWEGNTLVVEVHNNNDQTWLDASGNHHSDALQVEERYTRTDPDTLTYEVTLTDSKVYTRPWRIRMQLYRHKEPNFRVLEYECHAYLEDLRREQAAATK